MAITKTIDFRSLNDAAIAHCPGLLERLLPEGKLEGHEFTCGNLSGESGKSCKININNGKWSDFSTGESGGDIISLVAAIENTNQYQAAKSLAKMIGYPLDNSCKKTKEKPTPIFPVPIEKENPIPSFNHFNHGYPTETYTYRNEDGRLLGYTCRFNKQEIKAGGKLEKVFAPFIYTSKGWRWQGFSIPYPFYGLEKLANLQPDGLVIVVEGEGKANKLQAVMGSEIAVLAIHGGSSKTKNMNYRPLKGKKLLYWPDKDEPGYKAALEFAKKAQQLAESLKIVIPPEDVKETWDCANAIEEGWDKEKITAWIEANQADIGKFAKLANLELKLKTNNLNAKNSILPVFHIKENGEDAGLYYTQARPDGTSEDIWLGPPLEILAYTRTTESEDWGLMLQWNDPDGHQHTWAMPKTLLYERNSEWFSILAEQGWFGDPDYRKLITKYLTSAQPAKRIKCVTNIGWHGDRYILPDAIFGNGEDELVLQSYHHNGLYQTKGTMTNWQEMARLCVGNPKLGFALSCAFAGPLLTLTGLEGGGFSFEGESSCGKTTGLQIAASVWGDPKNHVRPWRSTDNALELTATLHNDNCLILDELAQVRAKVLDEAIYMLMNGSGKARASKDGSLRKSWHWRVLLLSSGELGLADKLQEAGRRSKAGQDARFAGIPVSKADIVNLHGLKNSNQLILHIKRLAETNYGHAGRFYLKNITQKETLNKVRERLRDGIDNIADSFCPDDCDGQVRRVALRFALVSIAGVMARELGLLPGDFQPEDYARTCFKEWLEQRGGIGAAEDMKILAQVQLFIEQHGQSRFMPIDNPDAYCPNMAGFREKADNGEGYVYYCYPEVFKTEIVKGYSPRQAVEALAKAGWLKKDAGRSTRLKWITNMGAIRVYMLHMPQEK